MAAENIGRQVNLDNNQLLDFYMDYVLEKEVVPKTVYRFCKETGITEENFYNFYGSLDELRKGIWTRFMDHTLNIIEQSSEIALFSPRERMLTLYFTFFEVLTANRSFVLFSLDQNRSQLKKLEHLKGVRLGLKGYAVDVVRELNDQKQNGFFKHSETVFSETVWLQLLFLLKFWMGDSTRRFESTDVAIEKSVNTVFDVLDNTALDRFLDFGKFLWKEKMA